MATALAVAVVAVIASGGDQHGPAAAEQMTGHNTVQPRSC